MGVLKVMLFGLLCGGLIFTFSILQDLFKYLFSLGALYVGYRFFIRNESRGMRIGFVAASVGFYFIYTFFYAVYLFMSQQAPSA